ARRPAARCPPWTASPATATSTGSTSTPTVTPPSPPQSSRACAHGSRYEGERPARVADRDARRRRRDQYRRQEGRLGVRRLAELRGVPLRRRALRELATDGRARAPC